MPQNAEAAAFLSRIAQLPAGPGISLDDVLKPSLADEAELRKLFAQEETNSRLADPHVGLVDVFDAPQDIRTTRARVVANEEDLDVKHVMPLSDERRRKEGSPAMVDSLEEFKKNWAVFTEGSLSQLTDWSNVVVAGGSVQACLAPVPDSAKASKRALRKYFHNKAFPTSDVDVFLYGLTPEQAETKINKVYEVVRDSIPWDVTCIRTKHTVSIHSQYPYRAVQIVLRLYQSPAEVLAGFDVDAPCCAYDGERVYANPRAIVAMMRQANTVDVTRRSPSYEVRLSKYSNRDYEVYVPQLNRADIDPTIFERSITRIQGLARLLVLERLATAKAREGYLQSRREIRGRPQQQDSWRRMLTKRYKGDLKGDVDAGLEMSDYDVISLHIPYGPGWDARRIEKLVYQTDLGMNSPYNPKNKGRSLHRHAAFFGTMLECLDDCCGYCPKPKNEEEHILQEEEDKSYLRGRVQFIVEDPGRQSISGSFNPIDDGEWSEQAYIGITEKFFSAIAAHDRQAVATAIKDGIDVNRRDHVGRTSLQVAVLSKAVDIACDLVDAGARMTARIVDGRTALHLAAQLNLPAVVRKLLERSAVNDEEAKAAAEKEAEEKAKDKDVKMDTDEEIDIEDSDGEDEDMRDSSEDDWSSDEDAAKKNKKNDEHDNGAIPEDPEDEPDVFHIDAVDWDHVLSALDYAVASGSLEVVELLLANGANPKLVTTPKHSYQVRYAHPLILAATTEDDAKSNQIAVKLIAAGAVTSEADDNLLTIFHRSIYSRRPGLVSTFLRVDPNAKVVLSVPAMDNYSTTVFPVVSAIHDGAYSVLAVLLAYGAKLQITRDDFERARDMRMKNSNGNAPLKFLSSTSMPIETALANCDESVRLLIALGADLNLPTRDSLRWGANRDNQYTPLDYARMVGDKIKEIKSAEPNHSSSTKVSDGTVATVPKNESEPAWKTACSEIIDKYEEFHKGNTTTSHYRQGPFLDEIKAYYDEAAELLVASQAKAGAEIWKSDISGETRLKTVRNRLQNYYWPTSNSYSGFAPPFQFFRHGLGNRIELNALYEELYEACWNGDNAQIRKLCLPQLGRKSQETPLQISVQWGTNYQGFTPLFIALHRRHWETAKLVLAIATAQYNPKEVKEKFSIRDLANPDDDSDDDFIDDNDEDEDMEPIEEIEIDLVDIAKIPTEVHSTSPPSHLLNNVLIPLVVNNAAYFVSNLRKFIIDDDFEAFTQILELYNTLPDTPLPYDVLPSLILHDRPAMLDEYIRRTGQGITIEKEKSDKIDGATTMDDLDLDTKAYLGLNVHGKKRKDLASKNDPHAYQSVVQDLPLLWQAAKSGAIGIVRYLGSDQPLAAYKYYASTHGDARAKLIRQVPDLAAVLPEKLGWATSPLNESVATAAIVGGQADMLESLCAMRGKEIESTLHLKHRTKGFNSILIAARYASRDEIKIFDFLLSKGISPLETDHNGSNLYHLLCISQSRPSFELLKYALQHLPKDVNDRLFRQQTKTTRYTPLHIAVKEARLDLVKVLIDAGASQHLVRESGGYTPLQIAVKENRKEITKLLVEAGPIEALTLEDGVGNTPLEVATRQAFLAKLDVACCSFKVPTTMRLDYNTKPFNFAKQEAELPLLRSTIETLLREGRLSNGTKLTKELLAFADHLDKKITEEKAAAEAKKLAEKDNSKEIGGAFNIVRDKGTASEILMILTEALAARPSQRHLVHLSDVHQSVTKSLEKFGQEQKAIQLREDNDDGFPDSEPEAQESQLTAGWDAILGQLEYRHRF